MEDHLVVLLNTFSFSPPSFLLVFHGLSVSSSPLGAAPDIVFGALECSLLSLIFFGSFMGYL